MRIYTKVQTKMKYKILHINTCDYGSTGNIAKQLCHLIENSGGKALFSVPRGRHNKRKFNEMSNMIGTQLAEDFHIIMGRLTGFQGCFSIIATTIFLRQIRKQSVDLIHLHNLHNSYINLPLLFNFIKKNDIPVVWTLHDCWSFTGHCPHFTLVKCDKWKTGCHHCKQYREYPKSYLDQSRIMYKLKKKWFTGVKNLTIVTPSEWLAGLVTQSFLSDYPVRTINNGVDLSVFYPRESNFRQSYKIPQNKKIVLGVAFAWGDKKGLDVFISLAKRLDQEKYQIVLVGTNDSIDAQLPSNVISIHRTNNQAELAEIYSAADVFVNPTREEVLGLVNVEALSCGTPGITFKSGGSPECYDDTCGSVVECNDIDAMEREVIRICEKKPYSVTACCQRAELFNNKARFSEYIKLYEEVLK